MQTRSRTVEMLDTSWPRSPCRGRTRQYPGANRPVAGAARASPQKGNRPRGDLWIDRSDRRRMALVPGGAPSARADAATWRGRLYADRFLIGCATVAGLVAVAIMFGMCGASLNFAIRADITLRNVVG